MASDRIDGWKAIGLHFGRDRSTVIRWAGERGMPVHAIPGGKTRTVYALRSELDAWAGRQAAEEQAGADQAAASATDAPPRRRRRPWRAAALAVALGGAAVAVAVRERPGGDPRDPLPADPHAAQLFVAARDDWAARTSTSLTRSIDELRQVSRIEPGFAPAYGDLATAYLLVQEAGSLAKSTAFAAAQAAAVHARALDPSLPAAYRALGFIGYWQRGDGDGADALLRQALALDGSDALTHFWYANILADRGDDARAMAEFDRARLLDPGSQDIAADRAWAQWSAGQTAAARTALTALVAARPGLIEARACLGMVDLGDGDAAGYADQLAARARLQARPALAADAAELQRARAAGDAALRRALAAQALREAGGDAAADHAEAAFIAGAVGDRTALMTILTAADRRGEHWYAAGYVRRLAAQWRGDATVTALLRSRAVRQPG